MSDPTKLGTVTIGDTIDPAIAIRGLGLAVSNHVTAINELIHSLFPYDTTTGKGGVSSTASDPRYTLPVTFATESGVTPLCTGLDGTSIYAFSGTEEISGTEEYKTIHPLLKKVDSVDSSKIRPRTVYESLLQIISYIDSSVSTVSLGCSAIRSICDIPIDCSTAPSIGDTLVYDGTSWSPTASTGLPSVSGIQYAVLQENPAGTPVFERLHRENVIGPLTTTLVPDVVEYEVGQSAVAPTFVSTYYRDATNVSADVTSTTIKDDQGGATEVLASGTTTPASTLTYTPTTPTTVTWTLESADPYVTGVEATGAAEWKSRIYWGMQAGSTFTPGNEVAIAASLGGGTSLVSSYDELTFMVNAIAGDYIYLLVPQDLVATLTSGRVAHPILNTNGFYIGEHFGGMQALTTTSITNAYGLSVTYNVYVTLNDGLGLQRVDVLQFTDEVGQ